MQTALTIGNGSNAAITGQTYQPSSVVPLRAPNVVAPTIPTMQTPPTLAISTPSMSIFDAQESNNDHRTTNLVKPSTFFAPPPSSSQLMVAPPVPPSMPTAPPLHPPTNLQRPYGTPLLQPFPPPTPPPSLTPSPTPPPSNYGPVISRDKVRDALLVLVQVLL